MDKDDFYLKGMEAFSEDRFGDAVTYLRQATELDADFADAYHALAMACYHDGDFDGSIQASKRLTELEPENILGWTSLSMAYQRKGMIAEAESAGGRAKALGFKDPFGKSKTER
ncbi:MAG TPA: tetratricopeptide repeat protein [Acidobacteriota bacterium]|jgi:Flp pilus assembly protein TadD